MAISSVCCIVIDGDVSGYTRVFDHCSHLHRHPCLFGKEEKLQQMMEQRGSEGVLISHGQVCL